MYQAAEETETPGATKSRNSRNGDATGTASKKYLPLETPRHCSGGGRVGDKNFRQDAPLRPVLIVEHSKRPGIASRGIWGAIIPQSKQGSIVLRGTGQVAGKRRRPHRSDSEGCQMSEAYARLRQYSIAVKATPANRARLPGSGTLDTRKPTSLYLARREVVHGAVGG